MRSTRSVSVPRISVSLIHRTASMLPSLYSGRDSSMNKVTNCGLDDRGSMPGRDKDVFLSVYGSFSVVGFSFRVLLHDPQLANSSFMFLDLASVR